MTKISNQYAPVNEEEGTPLVVAGGRSRSKLVTFGLVAFGCMGLVGVLMSSPKLLGSSSPAERACSFVECESGGCDPAVAPYLCVDVDGPLMGCSALAWPKEACADSCDMSDCADQKPSDKTATCKGVKCPDETCEGYQQCGDAAPYQCVTGSAAPGCSDDPYGWALAASTLCSKCCDTTQC